MNSRVLAGWVVAAGGLFLAAGCTLGERAGAPQSAPAAAAEPAQYVGSAVCLACHRGVTPAVISRFEQTVMGKVFMHNPRSPLEQQNCEACHGPGSAHLAAGGGKGRGVGPGQLITFVKDDPTPVEQRNAKCLACHQRRAHLFWKGSPHERNDVACTDCHSVMQPQSRKAALSRKNVVAVCGECHEVKRAQIGRVEHMPIPEGKISCTDCHNPHGSATPAMLKYDSPNETCYACHADKRGPFLWEHPPVEESCLNCHNPHGSDYVNLLTAPPPRLCQRCHDPAEHPSNPYNQSFRFAFNRGCVNCHANIHGSNHPSGPRLLR
jgi:DmsE family decaheme c-type cytochrome